MRILFTIGAVALLSLPHSALAATSYLDNASVAAYLANGNALPEDNISQIIGTFIQALLGILGVIFLVLTVYSGVLWMTAGGNTDQVKKAKAILVNAVIGLILTTASYAIAYFVVGSLT